MKRGLSIPLLLFAGLLLWTLMTPRTPLLTPSPPPPDVEEPIADSYGEDVVAEEFDARGNLLARTSAATLKRYRNAALVEMTEPRRASFSTEGSWVALANTGILYERRERMRLDGDVALLYAEDEAEFHSDSMLIDMQQQRARSLAPVTGRQGPNRLSADQLVVDLAREVAVLRGGVKSTYVLPE